MNEKNHLTPTLSKLLFEWPMKQAPRLALPFFILLAASFHFSTIYLFNITYQPSHVSKPVPAQIFFLPPGSSLSQEISSWLQANDPSIFSPLKTVQATRPALPSSIYEPGLVSLPLRSLPTQQAHPTQKTTDFLPPTNEIVLPSSCLADKTSSTIVATPPVQQATTIKLSDSISNRVTGTLGVPSLPPAVRLPLPPTKLTLNIDTEGIPRHVIILQSCGNVAADEAASAWALRSHFVPADYDVWGNLLVLWGTN
jgi:hypothetical protein